MEENKGRKTKTVVTIILVLLLLLGCVVTAAYQLAKNNHVDDPLTGTLKQEEGTTITDGDTPLAAAPQAETQITTQITEVPVPTAPAAPVAPTPVVTAPAAVEPTPVVTPAEEEEEEIVPVDPVDPVDPPVDPVDPVDPPVEPEKPTTASAVIAWLKGQLETKNSTVYNYFKTRKEGSSLDSTGKNFGWVVTDEMIANEVVSAEDTLSWKIYKCANAGTVGKETGYNIFWTGEDITEKEVGSTVDSVKYNTVEDKETEGTIDLVATTVEKKTFNVMDAESFAEEVPEA